jgi:hypothetical protein
MAPPDHENHPDSMRASPPIPGQRANASALPWSRTWKTVWICHVAGAVVWLWIMPGGFPLWHARFWANRAVPAIIMVVAVAGYAGAEKRSRWLYQATTMFFPMMWTASLMAAAVLFPLSSPRFLPPVLVGVIVLCGLGVLACRRQWTWQLSFLPVVLSSLTIGVSLPWTQRAADPDTHPRNTLLPVVKLDPVRAVGSHRLQLDKQCGVRPSDGSLEFRYNNLSIQIQPLLRFESVSPDRCWTLFAPSTTPLGSQLRLAGLGKIEKATCLQYDGDPRHFLRLDAMENGAAIDAFTELEQPVFSHLNSFCEIAIQGHRSLALSFSPCPDARIEVLPVDYPVGRPARHAYLAEDGSFHVVEAHSGEKGPFRTLAIGHLDREEALTITIHDEGQPVCRMVLLDWAAQAGVSLSPTAGWAVPVNAIEFRRLDDASSAAVNIWLTLAATSVGRGWDSVGHQPGIYRNRIRIERLAE